MTKPWTVVNFGNTLAMTILFFFKMFKIYGDSLNGIKNRENVFLFLRWLDLPRERQILTITNRILVIGSPCVSKQPYDFKLQSGRYFPNHFFSQWWKKLVKVLSLRFYQCLYPFNMLTVGGCFERALNIEWRYQALDSR